ncbi:hypothetical protein HC931_23555 [Candidatus Gracilibacteria bacterium]|nr:hypothetical protein [Candidatus Gracilibacteria bacterium]NJM89353.1 hypothetical protein [Hydrococcus sp. RU_2_2]NJP21205.1 hypothetical protein [Hydrococcus sp. CRU_1_1]NJQ97986.1 hypothetical protein [Hydrococcus sp. CSU_1_8]
MLVKIPGFPNQCINAKTIWRTQIVLQQQLIDIAQVNSLPKRFILNDSAGSTEIVFLLQSPSSADPQLDCQETETILAIAEVNLFVLKSFPSQLQIVASGIAPTSGWSNPQLVPYTYVQAPPDGIYDFDFVATPPQDDVAEVITPIRAQYIWPIFPEELSGVRIHTSTNSQVALLKTQVPPS